MVWRIPLLMCACGVLSARAQDYLLNSDVTPIHYDLMFVYDIDPETQFSYFGVVDILIKATKPTFNITLHAQEFNISDKEIKLFGPGNPTVGNINQDNKYNILNLGLDKELSPNENYTLTIPFSGNLKPGLEGAYISSYVDKATKNKEYLVTTQFESISARRAFPCFDEPAYKATFTINIGHHRDFTAVSNMPLESTSSENPMESYWPWELIGKKIMKDKGSFKWEQFAVSVPMSTYLVAWVVSKFSHVQSPEGLSKTKFRIWARSDAIDQTEYASIIGPKVLSHFEEFFNVSFPLPKQDMVAIPDFSAGAMENWGLITYRETALLYDREHSSFLNKERVAEVIAHELAHQWFGNLVTMKWWSDLWLNEGFATFMASVGVRAAEPTWHIEQTSEPSDLLAVMGLDALASSHPVSVPLDDPKRISEIFDEISYRKGSALIRMMNMFLGEDVFRKALNRYLLKYSYSNAEQDDLWRSLTEMSVQHDVLPRDVTVKQIMDTWTKQTGYPLLTVDRDYSDRSLTIKQKRYLSLGSRVPTSVSWWVPLAALCEGERAPARVQWLADNEGTLHQHRFEHGADSKQWVLFNYNMIAPYRVNYDKRNWLLLSTALNSENYKSIPTLGRVQLLSDAFELAWSNLLDYEVAMQLVSYLQRENEYLPLSTGLSALSKISNVLLRSPDYGALQKYIRKLITPAYERAGGLSLMNIINPDDMISVKMQTLTSAWACRMKVPGCEENAILMFQMWMDSSTPDEDNPIPLDLRRTVYCSGISRGGVLQWRFLLERRRNTNVAAARDAMLAALACSSDVWILAQYLEWAITENSEVRRQDAGRVIVSVASTPVGFYVAKDFIYDRIEEIYQVFKNQGNRLGMICKTLVQQFTTQRELDEFLVWREKNAKYLEGAKFGVEQAIEKARVNINWVTKNKKAVVELMRQYSKH